VPIKVHSVEASLACLYIVPKSGSWPPDAEARPDGALNNPLYVLPFNQIILNIKSFLHLGLGPPFLKCWNWVAYIRMRNEAITTNVVVILLLASSPRLVEQLVHVAEAFCAWL
jgi:hypothetical protein